MTMTDPLTPEPQQQPFIAPDPAPGYGPPVYPSQPPPQGRPAAAPKKAKTGLIIAAAAIGLIVFLAIAATAFAVLGQSGKKAGQPVAIPTPASRLTTQPPAAAPTVNPATTAMMDWRDQGGMDLLQAISRDMDADAQAASGLNVPGVYAACTAIRKDVEAAQAYKPMPDAEAQQYWAAALAAYARGATNCIAATRGKTIRSLNADLLRQSTDDFTEASANLPKITARIDALTG